MNKLRLITILLLFLTGVSALVAGYSFMADPSGKGIRISTEYLQYSPFRNFLIPGIILFVTIGVWSMLTAVAAIMKRKCYPGMVLVQGCILSGWILIQIFLVRDLNGLQITMLAIGIFFLFSGRWFQNQVRGK